MTVVSGMHGNERITFPLAGAFLQTDRPADMNVTITSSLSPDSWAANTRLGDLDPPTP